MNKVICIAGPTASGKTALAVSLAKALDGEVVSCDSMQIYRRMDIGTAKPTTEEMCGIPHHMLDVAEPDEDFSVSRYVQMADACVQDILSRGKTVIICGGTGLYMDSLIAGREFAPFPSTGQRELLEHYADEQGIEAVYDMLKDADPETAERLHLSDRKRIIRAMEVFLETGLPISYHNAQSKTIPPKYSPLLLGIDFTDRQTLYSRIEQRVDQMMRDGLTDEVRSLLDSGIPAKCTAMQAIGYKELAQALRGECTEEQAVDAIKQGSRRYAKRQLTWFRRNENIRWLHRRGAEDISAQALEIVHSSTDFDN